MIANAQVEGFKRFKEQQFQFAPLTVLTGLNGSGKTTLIQALLLTQEACAIRGHSVRLNGPYGMELGTAEDVLNWESREIRIGLQGTNGVASDWLFTVPTGDAMFLGVGQCPDKRPVAFSGAPRAFTYLSAERLGPRAFTETSSLPELEIEVGTNGEYCAHVLDALGNDVIEYEARAHPLHGESKPRLLKYEAEQWLSEIARPVEINGARLSGSTVAELKFRVPGSTWVRSTNMGFGVTYSLPIILAGLIAKPEGLLVIENPEAHLHPAGQSRMGVFLVWLAGSGVQILVETHSDHLLNGIRRGIAEHSFLAPSSAIIHWFGASDSDEDLLRVSPLRIGEAGSISEWPKGFFDQYQLDVASLGRIRRTRR